MSKNYEITIQEGSDVSKLIRSLASKNRSEFDAAMEAVAAFIQEVALSVIAQAPTVGNFFRTVSFDKGTAPVIPLDTYYDVKDRGFIQVWSQTMAGGLPSSFVKGLARMIADTYTIGSAVSMFKDDAAGGRVDILASTIERMAQELLIAHDTNSASVLSAALGQARYTNLAGAQAPQGIRAGTADVFTLNDFNRVITLLQRIRPSWVGGTPVGGQQISHLVGSPEFHEQLRSMAYQPQNTRAGSLATQGATAVPATDAVRTQVFNAGGVPSFFGVNLVNLYEMGVGQAYNSLFSSFIGSTTVEGSAFNPATEEVVWALNLSTNKNALIRLVEKDTADGSTLSVLPDDSFPLRSEKFGFYAKQKEGRVVTDSRNLAFVIV